MAKLDILLLPERLKTLSIGAANTYIAHIREQPPPRGGANHPFLAACRPEYQQLKIKITLLSTLELAIFLLQHVDQNANSFVSTCITITETSTTLHHWNAIPNLLNPHRSGRTNKPRRATCTTPNGQTNSRRAFLGKAGDGKEWTKPYQPYQGR